MATALEDYLEGRRKQQTSLDIPDFDGAYEKAFGEKPSSHVRTDEKARSIADTPVLTGDPEFDRLEMEETGYGD